VISRSIDGGIALHEDTKRSKVVNVVSDSVECAPQKAERTAAGEASEGCLLAESSALQILVVDPPDQSIDP
jgi:hypothetical protein